MSNLRELIPGSEFGHVLCAIPPIALKRVSAWLSDPKPVAAVAGDGGLANADCVSHGEGRVEVRDAAHLAALEAKGWWHCAMSITSAKSLKPTG